MNTTENTIDWMFVCSDNTTTPAPYVKAPAALFKALQVVIILVISVGLPGNLLTILAVCHYKRLRTAGNAFVTSMSVVDSLYYAFMLPIRFATYQYDGQFFSDQFCVFLGSFAHFVQGISVMSLSAISLNRLLFIRQHKYYHKIYSHGALIFQLTFIWGFSFFFTIVLPCSGLWGDFSFQEHVLACTFTPGSDPGYKITVVTCGFWVPTTFIVVCYSMIYIHFMSSHNKVNSWTNEQRKMTTVQPDQVVKPILLNKPKKTLTKIQEEEQTSQLRLYMNKKVKLYGTQGGIFSNGLSDTSCTASNITSAATPSTTKEHQAWQAHNLAPTKEERRDSNFSGNSGTYLIPENCSKDDYSDQKEGQSPNATHSTESDMWVHAKISKTPESRPSDVISKSGVSVNIQSPESPCTVNKQVNMPSKLHVRECGRQDSISSVSELLNHEIESNELEKGSDNNDENLWYLPQNNKDHDINGKLDESRHHLESNSAENECQPTKDIKGVNASKYTGHMNRNFDINGKHDKFTTNKTTGKGSNKNTTKNRKEELSGSQTIHNQNRESMNDKAFDGESEQRTLSASELLHLRTEVLMQKRKQLAHKEHHQNMNQTIANKRRKEAIRMTLMMLCIFCLFVICILPYFLVGIINSNIENASAYLLSLMCTWFNGCVNPVVYAMMNAQFRAAYKSLVSRCPPSGQCNSRDKVKGYHNSDKLRLQLNQSATHI